MRTLNKVPKIIAILALVILETSCSSVTAKRVKTDDYNTEGVRYWLSAPYLLVRAPVEVKRTEELYQLAPGEGTLKVLEPSKPDATPTTGQPTIPPATQPHASLPVLPAGGMASASSAAPDPAKPAKGSAKKSPTPQPKAGNPGFGAGGDTGDKNAKTDTAKPGAGSDTDASKTDPTPAAAPSSPITDMVSLVWLPDYCQQYAISSTNVLASSAVKYTLAEGWQLSQLDTTMDSTAVVNKILDVAGSVLTARAGGGASGGDQTKGGKAAAEVLHAGEAKYLRKTRIEYLKPGLYRLFQYPGDDCTKLPTLAFDSFKFETAEVWSELPLSKASQ